MPLLSTSFVKPPNATFINPSPFSLRISIALSRSCDPDCSTQTHPNQNFSFLLSFWIRFLIWTPKQEEQNNTEPTKPKTPLLSLSLSLSLSESIEFWSRIHQKSMEAILVDCIQKSEPPPFHALQRHHLPLPLHLHWVPPEVSFHNFLLFNLTFLYFLFLFFFPFSVWLLRNSEKIRNAKFHGLITSSAKLHAVSQRALLAVVVFFLSFSWFWTFVLLIYVGTFPYRCSRLLKLEKRPTSNFCVESESKIQGEVPISYTFLGVCYDIVFDSLITFWLFSSLNDVFANLS